MTKNNKNLFTSIIFYIFIFYNSLASDLLPDAKSPTSIRHLVRGAGEFADLFEGYLRQFQGPVCMVSDVDGVLLDRSNPNPPSDSRSRGDMVQYLNCLQNREDLKKRDFVLLFSSAWSVPTETFRRLEHVGLLDPQEKEKSGRIGCEQRQSLSSVSHGSFDNLPQNEEYSENCHPEEKTQYNFPFFKKGNCISVASSINDIYYRNKAFAPQVHFMGNPDSPQPKILVFMDDSATNIKEFISKLPLAQYLALETVLIFEFPPIAGEVRPEDKINPQYFMSSLGNNPSAASLDQAEE